MVNFRYNLPNMNAVVAFEAAARHLNFTKAAVELNVTRVAVSQQIKTLEEQLGVKLFNRKPRALQLTDAGQRYRVEVSEVLSRLLKASQKISQYADSSTKVTVAASAAVVTYWLMPRLVRFGEERPDIDIRVIVSESLGTTYKFIDLSTEGVDIAVRYGEGKWPGLSSSLLFEDEIVPLCSRDYPTGDQRSMSLENLAQHSLIHLEGQYHKTHRWSDWFARFGITLNQHEEARQIYVNTYSNLIQTALDAQGIALLSAPLVKDLIERGTLWQPLNVPVTKRFSFYLTKDEPSTLTDDAQTLYDWLVNFP